MLRKVLNWRLGVVLRLWLAAMILSWGVPLGAKPVWGATPPPAIRTGFSDYALPGNDDGSTSAVNLGFTLNFFGVEYSQVYVNNNGNLTFGHDLRTYTPFDLTSTSTPIIAPFFADVDTRRGGSVSYGQGMVDGHLAFGVNYLDVGYYSNHTDKTNDFQVVLIQREDLGLGDFDIEFNYGSLLWETGDASGGSHGLGGSSARAGYSNGSSVPGTFYEIYGSAVDGYFLDTAATGLIYHSINSDVLGRYLFCARNGTVDPVPMRYDFEFQFNDGSSDSYTGSVYALESRGYYDGYTLDVTDIEGSLTGQYLITNVDANDSGTPGQVLVTSYHDGESGNYYYWNADPDQTRLFFTNPVLPVGVAGGDYLGSEAGYIIQAGITDYLFGSSGGAFYEADLVAYAYNFTYNYSDGSGDSYTGTVYAEPEKYGLAPTTLAGAAGTYTFGTVTAGQAYDEAGNVYVSAYTDGLYGAQDLATANPMGDDYLTSESGYIIMTGVPEYFFSSSESADLVSYAYGFTFAYDEGGDTYTGTVYAEPEKYGLAPTTLAGDAGTYTFETVTAGQAYAEAGNVYVSAYTDGLYGSQTLATANPMGDGYLNSESGYILSAGVPEYYFSSAESADLVSYAYDFKFTYGNGDYYTGTIIAPVDYMVDNTQIWTDEHGNAGVYTITGFLTTPPADPLGTVYVTSYYDAESGQVFNSPGDNLFVTPGNNFLGSESGYIIQADNPEFFFGGADFDTGPDTDWRIFEAEGRYTIGYSFAYHFGDGDLYTDIGDYYTGTVYATPEDGYAVGDISGDVLDERFLLGYYSIDAANPTFFPYDKKGQVVVDSYTDADSGQVFSSPGVNLFVTPGAIYLGSESGYIIQTGNSDSPYYFGAGADGRMMEADSALTGAYQFRFTFAGGDFYTGTAYAELLHGYSVGQAWTTPDEDGQTGTYQITGVSYGNDTTKDGQVQINSYFDAETGKSFTPTGGGAHYLGSEYGSIGAGPKARFGGGYEEAEVSGKVYTFEFTYADGDSYTGTVYADPATSPYFNTYTKAVTDAHGEVGTYVITGVADGTAKDSKQFGKVFVSSYHDAQSGNDYAPIGATKALGSKGLGSESGYIVKKGTSYLQFGAVNGDFKEADLAAQYSFTYYYGSGSGDYYTGTLYATLGSYTVGPTMVKMDENGYQGYKIDAVSSLGYSAKPLGQVYVSSYFDAESGQTYKPLSKNKAAGTGGLGSEHDYIVNKNVPAYRFGNYGGVFYEANVN